jgi:Fe-S-cluster-containing dehydrogenase component
MNLMMKCDMCYDRTSVDLKPMCASVCPSQALFYGTWAEIEKLRPRSRPVNGFQFGRQIIQTRVNMMVPQAAPLDHLDVTAAMYQPTIGHDIFADILMENLLLEEK